MINAEELIQENVQSQNAALLHILQACSFRAVHSWWIPLIYANIDFVVCIVMF